MDIYIGQLVRVMHEKVLGKVIHEHATVIAEYQGKRGPHATKSYRRRRLCDVRLNDGTVLRGIPTARIKQVLPKREGE